MNRKPPRAARPEILEDHEGLTGFPPGTCPHVRRTNEAPDRPLSMAWISDELLAQTQRVWSKAFGRPVDVEEAVEILTNVKHLAEALARAMEGEDPR
jgi:hypothetical protein